MKFREIIVRSIDTEAKTYVDSQGITKGIVALDILLVPNKEGEHIRYVSDDNNTISAHKAGSDSTDTLATVIQRGNITTPEIGLTGAVVHPALSPEDFIQREHLTEAIGLDEGGTWAFPI